MQPTPVLVVLLIAALASVAQADKKAQLIPRYIQQTLGCMKETNVDRTVCKEMKTEGNDNTQEKYNPCKCMIACVAKKSGAMTAAGDANPDKITELVDEFEIPEWSEEWKRIRPICEPRTQGKKDCDLAYAFFECGYKESEIFRGVLHKFLDALEAGA